jgi:subtilisin family serine protease
MSILKKFLVSGAVVSAVAGLAGFSALGASVEPVRKIVVFSGEVNEPAREALVRSVGGVKVKNLDLIGGKAVLLPSRAVAALKNDSRVLRVDDDILVEALAKPSPVQPAQVLPWGIDRVDAELVWGTTVGAAVKLGVIDTGIELAHPDLAAGIKGGYNAIDNSKSANDDNGHGTHVAGIVGALNNSIGVVGIGPAIDLYAIKVLDRRGSGYLSDVIEGLNWAVSNGMQVVNMSLGSSSNVQSFADAVAAAKAAGLTMVAAAGNSGGAVSYPAAYPEVIAVSATDSNDVLASFSSRGPEVDLAAPGVSIYSAYKGKTYKTLNGTSMAAPHVAGAAALLLSVPAKCDLDLSGFCSPDEVQARLESAAIDLGAVGRDDLYGAGLLDVGAAILE